MGWKVPFSPAPEDIFAMGAISLGSRTVNEGREHSEIDERIFRDAVLASICGK